MQAVPPEHGQPVERPWVTQALVATNILVFLIALICASRLSNGTSSSMAEQLHDIALRYGLRPDRIRFYALFTSMFLHLDPRHLVLNMVFLIYFGRIAERTLGHIKFLILYLGCGLAAELLHIPITYLFLPDHLHYSIPTLGASGAISGILGFAAVRFASIRFGVGKWQIRASAALMAWLIWQLVGGVVTLRLSPGAVGIAYWAHIGGFLFGMIVGRLLRRLERAEAPVERSEVSSNHPVQNEAKEPRFHQGIAEIALKLGDTARAAEQYRRAMDLALRKGMNHQAIEIYEAAMEGIGPIEMDAPARYKLGLMMEEAGRYQSAAAVLEYVSTAHPESEEAELSTLKAAQIYLARLNSPEKAAEVLTDFLARYPGSSWRLYAEQIRDQARARTATLKTQEQK